jgi:hypothetical protein
MLGGLVLLAAGIPAFAQPTCAYQRISGLPGSRGVALERGTVSCTVEAQKLTSTVSVLRVDMTTPGRFLAATPPPTVPPQPHDNPANNVGSIFALQFPTSYLKSMARPAIQPIGKFGQAAVNANLFTNSPWYTRKKMPTAATWLRGLLIADGKVYNPIGANPDNGCTASPSNDCFPFGFDATLLFDSAGRASIRRIGPNQLGQLSRPGMPRIVTAVTGSHMLLVAGTNVAPGCAGDHCVGEFYGPNSRTAVGLSQGNRTLLIVAVDSTGGSAGVQLDQLAALMAKLGARDAINLDGGGSTTMAIASPLGAVSIVNRVRDGEKSCDYPTTGGCERYVGATLAVGIVSPAARPAKRRSVRR